MRSELKRFGHGFIYAWNGIRAALQEERNFRFHLAAACYVYAAAWLAELDAVGLALVTLCVFAMLGMELMNSAVERAVDKPDTNHWWSAGAAKDMAAGAVLVTAMGAAAVGVCVLGPHLETIWAKATVSPVQIALWLASLVIAYCFVFRYHHRKEKGENPDGKNDS